MAQWPGTLESASTPTWPGTPELEPEPVASATMSQWPGTRESGPSAAPANPAAPAPQATRPTAPPSGSPWSISRGFVTAMTQGNPESIADFLEGLSHDEYAPAFLQGPMRSASESIKRFSKDITPESYKRLTDSMYNIQDGGSALDWAMETIGAGVGSSVPSIALGAAGAGAGAAVGGPVGAVVGGVGGAGAASLAMNQGEVYRALRDANIDPATAQKYAKYAGPAMAALDVASLGTIVSRFGGAAAAKREINRALARRIASETGKGAVVEGSTEAMQELIKEATVGLAADGMKEGAGWRVLEAGVAGGLPGGVMAGPAGLRAGATKAASPEDIAATHGSLTEGAAPPPPAPPQLLLPPPQGVAEPPPINLGPPPIATQGPTSIEHYDILNPKGVDGTLTVQVTRGADGGMESFATPDGQQYAVPPDHRFAPANIVLSMKYGSEVDKNMVRKVEDPSAPVPATIAQDLEAEGKINLLMGRPDNFTPTPGALSIDDILNAPEKRKEGGLRVNAARMADMLGPKLYSDLGNTTVKELFQNAVDTVKGTFDHGQATEGNVQIFTDPNTRTITVHDDGRGMTPEIMEGPFLTIAESFKESDRSSGGFGIAKMAFLFGNESMKVTSMRDGKISEMITSGKALRTGVPDIITRTPTEADRRLFPKGHGTVVTVQVPASYVDRTTGRERSIQFPYSYITPRALERSPLFENINVTHNGSPLAIGNKFAGDSFTQFANINFDWGTARIYVTAEPVEKSRYSDNVHILSNGIWQFSSSIQGAYGPIQRDVYIDVSPTVEPEEMGYPFDLNRERFSPQAEGDFTRTFRFLSLMYQQFEHSMGVENFGEMQYIEFDPKTRSVTNSGAFTLRPPPPPPAGSADIARSFKTKGNKFSISEGKFLVNGKEVPELSSEQIDEMKIDLKSLKIPQEEIDANRVILHDNIRVSPTGAPLSDTSERVSLTQYAVAKYGQRFYDYVFVMGELFKQLRNVVSEFEHRAFDGVIADYSGLRQEAIGISFDKGYHGVSIRVPFSASFLNIAIPVHTDSVRAGLDFIGTMLHELGHHVHRPEEGLAPVLQGLLSNLNAHPTFDFRRFKQRVIDAVNQHHDIMLDLRGVFENGYVESGSRSFRTGDEQRRDGSVVGNVGDAAVGAKTRGHELRDWVAASETSASRQSRYSDGGAKASGNGDPSFGLNSNRIALEREAGHRDTAPVQRQPEVRAAYAKVARVMGGNVPPPVKAMAAHADRMNWVYKYFAGLLEVAEGNPRFTPVLDYVQVMVGMHREEAQLQDAGTRIVKDWRRLGVKQSEALTALIDDVTNMVYRTAAEKAAGVSRHPSPAEFAALVAKHKVGRKGLETYTKIKKYVDTFLDIVTRNRIEDARRLLAGQPNAIINEVNKAVAINQQLKSKPYFPFMRFGDHFVLVKNKAGDVLHFEVFERRGVVSAERQQMRRFKQLERVYPTDKVTHGVLAPDVAMIYGLPPSLLENMKNRLSLTTAQQEALQQLQYEMTPSANFKHRFQNKSYTPGYSHDFVRAFSRYAFYGARYHARTKYIWQAQDAIKRAESVKNQNNAGRIAQYMKDHLENTIINSKGDIGWLKAGVFFFALGYVPAAATANLTQTPMITAPYLAAKFGDHKAVAAIVDAMTRLNAFYRQGTYPKTGLKGNSSAFELKAMGYGIKTGRISETQAAELAALGQGNLILGVGGTLPQRAFTQLMEKSALFFEVAEQFNRRVAFRAALGLAMAENNHRFVDEAVRRNNVEYDHLVNEEGFSPQEARAVITANHVVEETQFVYAHYARPRAMRGKIAGTVFVFKRYIQSVMMLLLNNKKDFLPRYLLVAAALGGASALPGWDDIRELVEAGLKHLNYNVDLNVEMRRYIMQFTNGKVPPDMVLHGLARRGFGLPALLDGLGSYATGRPGRGLLLPEPQKNTPWLQSWPWLDRSKSITGPLLPVEIGKMMQPFQKTDKMIAEQAQRASGAAFSVFFNMYKAAMDPDLPATDWKRWEKAMPRAFGSVSKATRTFTEGKSRDRTGAPQIEYDVRDPEQLAEIIFQGLGYQTLREAQKWDQTSAIMEHKAFVAGTQKMLYSQLHEAIQSGNEEERAKVVEAIHKFNDQIRGTPDAGYTITSDSARKSIQTRARDRALKEMGLPPQKRDVPIYRDIQGLFPESVIDVKRR